MTAEIAILNKTAVALAADSAVTMRYGEKQKIYNTMNKLFALSKYRPVGIMVYGNAEFMGIPWESIIKYYRSKLGTEKYKFLNDYSNSFIKFLENENVVLWPEDIQLDFFRETIENYYSYLVVAISEKIDTELEQKHELSEQDIQAIVDEIIRKDYETWSSTENLGTHSSEQLADVITRLSESIKQLKKQTFEKLPLSEDSDRLLTESIPMLFLKDRFPNSITGIVIAGFGESEIFPSAISYTFQGIVCGKLKYKQLNSERIDRKKNAIILPFAQHEMVNTFIEGIDPSYRELIQTYLTKLINGYSEKLLAAIPELSADRKAQLTSKFNTTGLEVCTDFNRRITSHAHQNYISPILHAVAALPKDELAAMAESLVNLTSFKRRVSLQAETVGGAIDVAVISKGDGFIWIKRKHYFKPDLNQSFFSNYYNDGE